MSQFEKKERDSAARELAANADQLLESSILHNLSLTPEQRIEAHENARELMADLRSAGRQLRAAESESTS